VETVIEVNEARKRRMVDKITDLLGGSVNGKKIAVLGVTFKPESPTRKELSDPSRLRHHLFARLDGAADALD
jgi:UDP-glucose 6-dehydrogenase